MAEVNAVMLHPHSTGEDDYHMWIFLPGYAGSPITVYLDSLGRPHRHAWREWVVLICNNTECHGRCAVRADVITDLAQTILPVPTGGEG